VYEISAICYLFYNSPFSDITKITALLRHSAYAIADRKVIKME